MRQRFEHNGREFYLVRVDQEDVEEAWPHVRDSVHRAWLHSDSVQEGDDFLGDLRDGICDLWMFISEGKAVGHMITQVVEYPRKTLLRVLTMECQGGEKGMLGMDLWAKFVPIVEEYALQRGCVHLEAYTRRGMARALQKHGWENQFNIVTKQIG
jgi:hypothetical protein